MGKVVNPLVFFRLKDFRLEHELKQTEMADILGIQQCSISSYERTKKELSQNQYKALFDKFGEEEVLKYRVTNESGTTYNINEGGIIGNGNTGNTTSFCSPDSTKLAQQNNYLLKQNERLQESLGKKDEAIDKLQERLFSLQDQVTRLLEQQMEMLNELRTLHGSDK